MLKKMDKSVRIFLILMIILSFINILNIKINGETVKLSGVSVIVGVIAFFITRKTNKTKVESLDIKNIFKDFNNIKAIIFTLLSFVSVILCIVMANKFLPEFNEHLNNRISFLNTSEMLKTIFNVAIATLGEEIAWRAFFQKQTSKIINFIPSIILTSILFAIGHYSSGGFLIVVYDLLFVFLDSLIFGFVFHETNNAWCSWIPHFLADVFVLFII